MVAEGNYQTGASVCAWEAMKGGDDLSLFGVSDADRAARSLWPGRWQVPPEIGILTGTVNRLFPGKDGHSAGHVSMTSTVLREHNMRALTRGIEVLRYLNSVGSESGPRIAGSLGLSRATVGRILATLEECGLVRHDGATGLFRLAAGVRGVSEGPTEEARAVWLGAPVLYDLQHELLWPTCLATIENGKIVIRESTDAVSPYSIDGQAVGSSHPLLYGSLGRAYVGFSCDEDRRSYLKASGVHYADGSDLSDKIDELVQDVRTKGYAYRQQGAYPKTSSIAVPIRSGNRVVASMNVVWIASAMTFSEAVRRFLPPLSRARERIERALASDQVPANANREGSFARLAC